ncbi:MAG: hypothetical protein ACM31C_16910 [Acidobacteriota bacterium]
MSARAKKPTTKPPPRAKSATLKGSAPGPGAAAQPSIYDSGNFHREPATPIRAISMKTPGADASQRDSAPREVPKVKLRAMSEVHQSGSHPAPQNLGYLAPPRNAAEVRARRIYDYVLYGSVSVIVASVVALIIWFAARAR